MIETAPTLRRLLPGPTEVTTVRDAYDVVRPHHEDRPWVGLCMVMSADGSVAVGGGSGDLGNPNDLDVLLTLRRLSDLVVVGSGTARGEGYGPPEKPDQRIGVVTNSGRVDLDEPLFASGAGFVITAENTDIDERRVDVLRAGRHEVDLAIAIATLDRIEPGVTYVHAEGGPSLNGSLLDADLVDELDLTTSPHLVGGDGPRLTTGAAEALRRFRLEHLISDDDGFVFARYLRDRTPV